jgi:predicted MFS family arabinose efflux permease
MPARDGVIGLTDAVAAPFLRPFQAVMGADGGWRTACAAVATYAVAAVLVLRALRRAEGRRE